MSKKDCLFLTIVLVLAGISAGLTVKVFDKFFPPEEVETAGAGRVVQHEEHNIIGTSASSGAVSISTSSEPIFATTVTTTDTDAITFKVAYKATSTVNQLQIMLEESNDDINWYPLSYATTANDSEIFNATSSFKTMETNSTERQRTSFTVDGINTDFLRLRVYRGDISDTASDSNGELYIQAVEKLTF